MFPKKGRKLIPTINKVHIGFGHSQVFTNHRKAGPVPSQTGDGLRDDLAQQIPRQTYREKTGET